jgi:hypothetical protein
MTTLQLSSRNFIIIRHANKLAIKCGLNLIVGLFENIKIILIPKCNTNIIIFMILSHQLILITFYQRIYLKLLRTIIFYEY